MQQATQRHRYGALDISIRNATTTQLLKMPGDPLQERTSFVAGERLGGLGDQLQLSIS
jgi:hypothetical protein